MNNQLPHHIYFVGAGGIGMAALERYCLAAGILVAGYDLTPSPLTEALQHEGVEMTFEDDPQTIPLPFRDPADTLVVYTPAVPDDNHILQYFRQGDFTVIKRSEFLGRVTRVSDAICVAGSHGKTTTSSMIAHILDASHVKCNAFLGGILRNNDSNCLLSAGSRFAVVEADEYDRSFHRLHPYIAIVTSTDPDHLDIYGDEAGYLEGFAHFTELIRPGGTLILHTGLKLHPRVGKDVKVLTYSAHGPADWYAENLRYGEGTLTFDIVTPDGLIADVPLGVPVEINVDNAVAAAAACRLAGATDEEIRNGLATYMGSKRRFEIIMRPQDNPSGAVLIDDYAHSPHEIEASITSVRKLFPGRRLTVAFMPHLYTRTRDFAPEFAEALSLADHVILTEIYPARELPIPGVTSQIIFERLNSPKKELIARKDLLNLIKKSNFEIFMTLGAANLDLLLPQIKQVLCAQPPVNV